jgi:hypothetical protein
MGTPASDPDRALSPGPTRIEEATMVAPPALPHFDVPPEAPRRRWHLLYLLLAAFDIVTVCTSLVLSHRLVEIHTQSLEVSESLSTLQSRAGAVNAPGNDVFDSRDVVSERLRFERALGEFQEALAFAALQAGLEQGELSPLRDAMARMAEQAEWIFHAFEAGEPERAGERMATMDRCYGDANRAISNLGTRVRAAQFEEAESLGRAHGALGAVLRPSVVP